jgi:hypothetical protein
LPIAKRSEDLVIKAVRPAKKHLFGPADIRGRETIKNVGLIDKSTRYTPRVYSEIVRLMQGSHSRNIKKMIGTLEKQGRKLPDELRTMLGRIKNKALSSAIVEATMIEVSKPNSASIVHAKFFPYTITVKYPSDNSFTYEYYIGSPGLFNEALGHQYNAGQFSAFVKKHEFSVKKLKVLDED